MNYRVSSDSAFEVYQHLRHSRLVSVLWHQLGNTTTILDAPFPKLDTSYLVESTKEYPVSVNGKLRTTINIDLSADQGQVEGIVLSNAVIQKWLEGKSPKKIIFVKGKMVNVVV